ncbi:MAG: ABC transporter permease [Alphaproteobacteria bacterium]|nr:ABC transporter permease [Alphaproteobacteria bacterium]
MSGPPIARIAWRNLWRNRRRTALTLVAIAFGILLAILFTALQDQSFADMIDDAARLGTGHVTVQQVEYLDTPTLSRSVPDAKAVQATAMGLEHVVKAVPRIQGQAMLATAGQSYGAFVMGYDPTQEDADTFNYGDDLVEGEMLSEPDGRGIVLGERLARNLGLELGDKVVYTLMDKSGEITGGLARLSGIIDTGSDGLNGSLALLPIDAMRRTLGYGPDEATQVAIFVDDGRRSEEVTRALDAQLGEGLDALEWTDIRPELRGFIAMKVGGARFMEMVIMILVAASIFNTLFVSVMERMREFGILRAIGMTPGQLFALVVWESVWLGMVGVGVGGAITYPLYSYLHANGIDMSAAIQANPESNIDIGGVAMSLHLNVGIFPENALIIVLIALTATVVSGLWPAVKAGQVTPVEAIKLV